MNVSIEPMYLSRQQVAQFVSLSEPQITKLAARGLFPKPRKLSAQRVGWLVRELREWAESRPVSDLPPPPSTGQSNRGRKPAVKHGL